MSLPALVPGYFARIYCTLPPISFCFCPPSSKPAFAFLSSVPFGSTGTLSHVVFNHLSVGNTTYGHTHTKMQLTNINLLLCSCADMEWCTILDMERTLNVNISFLFSNICLRSSHPPVSSLVLSFITTLLSDWTVCRRTFKSDLRQN